MLFWQLSMQYSMGYSLSCGFIWYQNYLLTTPSSQGRSSRPPGDEVYVGKYKLLKTIGKGNFAKVKLARHMPTGQDVSVCVCVCVCVEYSEVVMKGSLVPRHCSLASQLDNELTEEWPNTPHPHPLPPPTHTRLPCIHLTSLTG